MKIDEKMYTILFNSITNVHEKLKIANKIVDEVISDLEKAQICAEDIYIEKDE